MSPAKRSRKLCQIQHSFPGVYPAHDSPYPPSLAPSKSAPSTPLDPNRVHDPGSQMIPPPLTYAQVAAGQFPPLVQTTVSEVQAPNSTQDGSEHRWQSAEKVTLRLPTRASRTKPAAKSLTPGLFAAATPPADTYSAALMKEDLLVANSTPFKDKHRIFPAVPQSLDHRMQKLSLKDARATSPLLSGVNNLRHTHDARNSGRPTDPTIDSVRRRRTDKLRGDSQLSNDSKTGWEQVEKTSTTNLNPSKQHPCSPPRDSGLINTLLITPSREVAADAQTKPKGTESKQVSPSGGGSEDLESALRDISLFQGLHSATRVVSAKEPSAESIKPPSSSDRQSATTLSPVGLVTLLAQPGSDDDAGSSVAREDDFEHVDVPKGDLAAMEREVNGRQKRGWTWLEARK
jgi:hypothetical protein